MKQIRKGTFETNSSSTHVICIQKDDVVVDFTSSPIKEKIGVQSFGWEHEKYYDWPSKLMYYLIGVIRQLNDKEAKEEIDHVKKLLSDVGVIIELPKYVKEDGYSLWIEPGDKPLYFDSGAYIDHSEALGSFVDYIREDNSHFYNFLFGIKSYIETGNDNDGTFPDWYDMKNSIYKSPEEYARMMYGKDYSKEDLEDVKSLWSPSTFKIPDDVVMFFKGN